MTPHVSIDDILLAVQRVTKTGVREIKNERTPRARRVRMLFYFVASQCFDKSHADIALAVGRKPKTVQGMVREMRGYTRFDPELIDQIEEEAEAIYRGRLRSATELQAEGMR